MVVLPEPETPVTTVRRPLGISTLSGFTVWMASVVIVIFPSLNMSVASTCCLTLMDALPERNGPIFDRSLASMSLTVPCAITLPPSEPAPGPISIIQSDLARICVSWSTSTTEFPSAIKSSITPQRPMIFDGCRPIDGSSKTYRTPVVRFRTALASCILCRSPVERVDAERSRDR